MFMYFFLIPVCFDITLSWRCIIIIFTLIQCHKNTFIKNKQSLVLPARLTDTFHVGCINNLIVVWQNLETTPLTNWLLPNVNATLETTHTIICMNNDAIRTAIKFYLYEASKTLTSRHAEIIFAFIHLYILSHL